MITILSARYAIQSSPGGRNTACCNTPPPAIQGLQNELCKLVAKGLVDVIGAALPRGRTVQHHRIK